MEDETRFKHRWTTERRSNDKNHQQQQPKSALGGSENRYLPNSFVLKAPTLPRGGLEELSLQAIQHIQMYMNNGMELHGVRQLI